jgi:hypothetical protein
MDSYCLTKEDTPEHTAEDRESFSRCMAEEVLSQREFCMLARRFGVFDGHRHSHAEIAKEFNLSSERVRVITNHAVWRLERTGVLRIRSDDSLIDFLGAFQRGLRTADELTVDQFGESVACLG